MKPLNSTQGWLWILVAFGFGCVCGALLPFVTTLARTTTPRPLRERRRDAMRLGFGALLMHYAVIGFWALLYGSVYHSTFRTGIFWALAFPPIMSYGVAVGYALTHRYIVGFFPPVIEPQDEKIT